MTSKPKHTLAPIFLSTIFAVLSACSNSEIVLKESSADKGTSGDQSPDTLVVAEPIAVGGAFLNFQCELQPESVLPTRNQVAQCAFANEDLEIGRSPLAKELEVSGVHSNDYLVRESKSQRIQWNIWFRKTVDLQTVRIKLILEENSQETTVNVSERLIGDAKDKKVLLNEPEIADLLEEDKTIFPEDTSPDFALIQSLFMAGEPNNDAGNNENCITYFIDLTDGEEGLDVGNRRGWNDENCSANVEGGEYSYQYLCRSKVNSSELILSDLSGNPAVDLADGVDPCPEGYKWSHPVDLAETAKVRIFLEPNLVRFNLEQVWFNLRIENKDVKTISKYLEN